MNRNSSDPYQRPPTRCGGTISDVVERLDHIQSLGFTAVMLTPVLDGTEYHGYHITDLFSLDPRFGTLADLQRLRHELTQRGIRLILDVVVNHCSDIHPFFLQARAANGYRDWFHFEGERYLDFYGVGQLPKWNLEPGPARDHLIESVEWLVNAAQPDALRMDHAIGPPHSFWAELIPRLKARSPELKVFGEVWAGGVEPRWADRVALSREDLRAGRRWPDHLDARCFNLYHELGFDGFLDFATHRALWSVANGWISTAELHQRLQYHYRRVDPEILLVSFWDHHDVDRVTLGRDVSEVQRLIQLLLELPQPRMITYGTEFCLPQERTMHGIDYGDVYTRGCPSWDEQVKLSFAVQRRRFELLG